MRMIFCAFFLSMLSLCSVVAQNEAVYIYRNDGVFNAFLQTDIDSIAYSHLDKDSVYHKEWQTQVIYTHKGNYSIPLALIDSVSFVTPEPIVNNKVFELTSAHDKYLSECDTLQFTLDGSTPASMRPVKGNIVVSTSDCVSFPDGIMARVVSVESDGDGTHYNCVKVGLNDVYDRLVMIEKAYIEDIPKESGVAKSAGKVLESKLWEHTWNQSFEVGDTKADFKVNDLAEMVVTVCIQPDKPMFFRLELQNKLESDFSFNTIMTKDFYFDKPLAKLSLGRIRIPSCPLLYICPKFDLSAYVAETGEVTMNFDGHYNRTDRICYTFQNGRWGVTHTPVNDVSVNVSSLSMTGNVEVGVLPNISFSFCGSATGIGVDYKAGVKSASDFNIDNVASLNESVYEKLKDRFVRTTLPQNVRLYAHSGIFGNGVRPLLVSRSCEPQWGEDGYPLPLILKSEHSKGKTATSMVVKTALSRDVLFPVEVGLVLYEDGKYTSTKYVAQKYVCGADWNYDASQTTFDALKSGKNYMAYPVIKIMGKELRADSATSFALSLLTCPDRKHPHAIDLGLPSGLKWCCSNVGAIDSEYFGGYYSWGEVEEKEYYTWRTYFKYNGTQNSCYFFSYDISGTEYDVAHVKMGGTWRMPTAYEFVELAENCKVEYATRCDVPGFRLTGTNGGSIFFPLAGVKNENGYWGKTKLGYYWLSTAPPYEWHYPYAFQFSLRNKMLFVRELVYPGFTVRAVCP